ncbi:hypothetical protein H9Q73_008642 [Fusarium xylarioides]|nr:hypothetical protein H9Q73_008642 [Fusarium xylarioides]
MPTKHEAEALVAPSTPAEAVNSQQDGNQSPRTLKDSCPSLFWRVGMPALLLIIPLAYVGTSDLSVEMDTGNALIVLMVMTAYLDGRERSDFGDSVREVLQIASTLWPISFAAVLGPTLKTLALHSAERGSRLGLLEFLLSSQTTFAALKNLVLRQHLSIWTIGIGVLWCLSPLGGQAAVRSLHPRPNSTTHDIRAMHYLRSNVSDIVRFYQGNEAGEDAGALWGGSGQSTLISGMRSIVVASFSSPDILVSHGNGSSVDFVEVAYSIDGADGVGRLGRRDLWQNVRIPYLQLLPEYNPEKPHDWITVPSDWAVPWVSLVGIPIRGGSTIGAGNSTMVVQSHYQTFSCGDEFNGTNWVEEGSQKLSFHDTKKGAKALHLQEGQENPNGAKPNIFIDIVNSSRVINDHNTHWQGVGGIHEPTSKLELVVGGICSNGFVESTYMLRTCKISTSYAEVGVACSRLGESDSLQCQADRVRHTPGRPISGNLTAVSSNLLLGGLIYEFPFITASYYSGQSSAIERYLWDPPTSFGFRGSGPAIIPGCFPNVSTEEFQARLSTALNTVIMATYNATVLMGVDGASLNNRNSMWHNTTAEWSRFTDDVYVLSRGWFAIAMLSTVVLLGCAVANVVIRCFIKAPDFLNSVTGMTRDSPYIRVKPSGGSGVSSCDKIVEVKDVRVRICDVRPESEVVQQTWYVGYKMPSARVLMKSEDADGPCDYCRSIDEVCSVDMEKRRQKPFYFVSEEEYRLLRELCSKCFPEEELTIPNLRRLIDDNQKPAFKTQTDIATPTMSLIEVSAEAPLIDCGDEPIDQGEILLHDLEEAQAEEEEILLPEIVNLHHDLGCLLADAHGEYRYMGAESGASFNSAVRSWMLRMGAGTRSKEKDKDKIPGMLKSLAFQSNGFTNSAYLYIGLAVRIAFSLGLHLDKYSTKSGVVSQAHARRLWWTLYLVDQDLSLALGKPSMNSPPNETSWKPPLPSEFVVSPGSHTPNGYLEQCIGLAQITQSIRQNLYDGPVHGGQKLSRTHFNDALTSLQDWLDRVPPHLHLSPSVSLSYRRSISLLHLRYWSTMMLVTKPFLLCNLLQGIDHVEAVKQPIFATLAKICVSAAESSFEILESMVLHKVASSLVMADYLFALQSLQVIVAACGLYHMDGHQARAKQCLRILLAISVSGYPKHLIPETLFQLQQCGLAEGVEDTSNITLQPSEPLVYPQMVTEPLQRYVVVYQASMK